jgi:hypothetical protein
VLSRFPKHWGSLINPTKQASVGTDDLDSSISDPDSYEPSVRRLARHSAPCIAHLCPGHGRSPDRNLRNHAQSAPATGQAHHKRGRQVASSPGNACTGSEVGARAGRWGHRDVSAKQDSPTNPGSPGRIAAKRSKKRSMTATWVDGRCGTIDERRYPLPGFGAIREGCNFTRQSVCLYKQRPALKGRSSGA